MSESQGSSRRKRRSPRLPKSVEVRLAGRGASGEVIVESTETLDISKHGACVVTRNAFPLGSPIAIHRPGGKPMRARVVSSKAVGNDGILNIGVEFVGDDGNWDLEFPKDWDDYFVDPKKETAQALSNGDRPKLRTEDGALEGVLRKAESLRAQAESMLAEYNAQLENARRQNSSALAAHVEEFRAWKSVLEGATVAQLGSAKEAINADIEQGRRKLEQHTASLAKRVKDLAEQSAAGVKSSEELHQQVRVTEAQKNVQQVAHIAAQLDAQRKTMAALEEQAVNWRQGTAANIAAVEREIQGLLQKAVGEMQTSSAGAAKDFRQKLPVLGQEMEKYFATFLGEQKTAGTAWLEEAAKNMRAGASALEKEHRAALEKTGQQSIEEFAQQLTAKLDEFRKVGEAMAEPFDARSERMRGLLDDLTTESDQTVARARQNLGVVVEKTGEQLKEIAAAKTKQINDVETAARQRLLDAGEKLLASAHDTTRRVDQRAIDLEALGASLHQQAGKNRKELEAQFAGLLAMYDNRKEALDRLLETLDAGRATLRDGIEMLRVNAQEQQARLLRFTSEQESSLKNRTVEMEQRLAASITRMEAEMRERAAAVLQTAQQSYSARLDETAESGQARFSAKLESAMQAAAERIPVMLRELDQCLEQHTASMAADLALHQAAMGSSRTEFEQTRVAAHNSLQEKHVTAEESLRQAHTAALASVDDHQAAATSAVDELVKGMEQHRAATARQHEDQEKQIVKWRQGLDRDFLSLSGRLDEKKAALESFYVSAEQTKAAWVKNMGVIDRRIEDARSAIAAMEKQMAANMEKHAATLGETMETRLRQSFETAQHELSAVAEAGESVYQARLKDFSAQSLKAMERQVDQSANGAALSLDRTMQKERREHELQISDMGRRADEMLREQLEVFREAAAQASGEMREQMQQAFRAMLDQVRDAREELARDLPSRLSQAEEAFRRNLERIQERTVAAASEELKSQASQWKARNELEEIA